MSLGDGIAAGRRWRKPPLIKNPRLRWGLALFAALYLAAAFGTIEVHWTRVWDGLPRGEQFLLAFLPSDFATRWDDILEGLWMTVTATVVGIAISVPIGLGAAKNIAPAPVY